MPRRQDLGEKHASGQGTLGDATASGPRPSSITKKLSNVLKTMSFLFFKDLFYLLERQSDKEGKRKIFYILFHSPNGYNA